tara:strand:+ start:147 stop:848 length:702 start_codon:yes stop_codon:yes gene_type:complete
MRQFVLFIFSLLVLSTSGQTLHVEAHQNNLSSNDLWSEMVTEIKVENISQSNTIDVKVSKEVLSSPAGSSNYFCWVNCFLAGTMVSPTQITFAPGDIDDINFSVHYSPQGLVGLAAIKYCAFDANNIVDSACTIVHFNTVSTNIFEDQKILSFSDFQPNPTSLNTEMKYNLLPSQDAEVQVIDMLGNMVKKHKLSSENGRLAFTITDLKAGLYFANIMVNGQLHEIKRLIVSE